MLTLPFPSPDHDAIRTARLRGDVALDDRGFACASGMFCRLTCTRAEAAKVLVRPTVADCLRAGLRPCSACRPLGVAGDRDASIARLLAAREDRPGHRWSASDVSALGHDPAAVARAFRRHMGLGFLELARILRTDAHDGAGRPDDAGVPATVAARDAVERLLHGDGPAAASGDCLAACWIETPIGTMLAVSDDARLHLLEFHDRARLPGQIARLRRETGTRIAMGRAAPLRSIGAELDAYFAGRTLDFATAVAASPPGFNGSVWEALRDIPPGETLSYGALATRLGRASAVRAAARANGANRLAIVVPCHRVIGADGSMTGYAGGVWRKQWLLGHERRYAGAAHAGRRPHPVTIAESWDGSATAVWPDHLHPDSAGRRTP